MKESQDSGVILFNLYYLEQSCTPSVMRSSLLYKVAHPLFGQLSLLEFFFFFFTMKWELSAVVSIHWFVLAQLLATTDHVCSLCPMTDPQRLRGDHVPLNLSSSSWVPLSPLLILFSHSWCIMVHCPTHRAQQHSRSVGWTYAVMNVFF